MSTIVVIVGAMALIFFMLFNLSYWVYIFPQLRKDKKTSFPKAFFIWGQQIVDLWKYEKIAVSNDMKNKLRLTKIFGLISLLLISVTFVIYLIHAIISKSI